MLSISLVLVYVVLNLAVSVTNFSVCFTAVISLWFALCIWRVARHPPHVARARARQPSEAGDGYEVSVSSHWLAGLMAISEYRVHH